MKKRILFVMSQFNMGGIEKELLCLLNAIDQNTYILELYLTGKGGQLESEIPNFVKVYYPEGDVSRYLMNLLKQKRFLGVIKKLYYYLRMKLAKGCAKDYWGVKIRTISTDQYDCAIAYDGLDMAVISTVEEIKADTRLLWEHGPLIGIDDVFKRYSKKASRSFDKIVCVSEALKNEFQIAYDLPDNKACVLYNLVNVSSILEQSNIEVSDMLAVSGQTLVTVGRLHPQKWQDIIPRIARMLVDEGYDIYWYLVGDGILRQTVEDECRKYNVTDRVILLGSKSNPYPYIRKCDIYVQTSAWEGWGLTVQEARILGKPIVVTPLPVFYEQIISGINGLIADAMTQDALVESIKQLLDNPQMQERFVCELNQVEYENMDEIQKLYDMIG